MHISNQRISNIYSWHLFFNEQYIQYWGPIRLKISNPPDEAKTIISGARQGVMSGVWHGIGMSLEFSICWKWLSGLALHWVQHPFLPMTWCVSKPYGAPFCGACTVTDGYRQWKTWRKTWSFLPADWAPPRAPLFVDNCHHGTWWDDNRKRRTYLATG